MCEERLFILCYILIYCQKNKNETTVEAFLDTTVVFKFLLYRKLRIFYNIAPTERLLSNNTSAFCFILFCSSIIFQSYCLCTRLIVNILTNIRYSRRWSISFLREKKFVKLNYIVIQSGSNHCISAWKIYP